MATPYNGFDLPVVGADADTWGSKLNVVMTAIDTLLSSPPNTIKGNNTGSQVATINLNPAQVQAMLPAVVGDSGSGGTKGAVPAPASGDAAAQRYLTAAGTWVAPIIAKGVFVGVGGATVSARNLSCTNGTPSVYVFTFGSALANANYVVHAIGVGNYPSGGSYMPIITTKTVNGFTLQMAANIGGSFGGYSPTTVEIMVVA